MNDNDKSKEQLIEELNVLRRHFAEQEARHAQIETALEINVHRLIGILEIAYEAIISIDGNNKIILFNKGTESVFGYTTSELIGQPIDILIPKRFRASHQKHIQEFLDSDIASRVMAERNTIYGLRKSGEEFLAEASISKLQVGDEIITSVILRDISQRKEIEKRLAQSEERHRNITSMISDYAYEYRLNPDGTGRFVWITGEAFTRITGFDPKEMETGFNLYHPEDKKAAIQDVNEVIAGKDLKGKEYRIIRKDGELAWIRVHRKPMWDEKGEQVIGFYGAISDITQSKKAEEQRLELMLEKKRVELLANFITQASHEFRTPLSIIKTSTYLLSKLKPSWDEQRHLNNIDQQIDNITTLVSDLITLSTLDRTQALKTETIDLHLIIRSVHAKMQENYPKKNLTVNLEIADGSLWTNGHMENLQQAIEHIFNNAIQFANADASISICSKQNQEQLIIEIADTGIGIHAEDLPYIFDRFYRVNQIGTFRGFGLGLAIAKRCIELHQGRIEVESEFGLGSTFRIILPKQVLKEI